MGRHHLRGRGQCRRHRRAARRRGGRRAGHGLLLLRGLPAARPGGRRVAGLGGGRGRGDRLEDRALRR